MARVRRCFLMRDGVNYAVVAVSSVAAAVELNEYCGTDRIYNYEPRDLFKVAADKVPELVSGYDAHSMAFFSDAHACGELFKTDLLKK